MKNSGIYTLFCILIVLSHFSCKKKLSGSYTSFEGKYEWQFSNTKSNVSLFSANFPINRNSVGYTVSIELTGNGEVLFLKKRSITI